VQLRIRYLAEHLGGAGQVELHHLWKSGRPNRRARSFT
jgi:hypothetical protein